MSKHRKTGKNHVNPMLGGALLAGGMVMLAPIALASADETNPVNGRPALRHDAPGVEKIQKAGDAVLSSHSYLDGTGLGAGYHGLFGTAESATGEGDGSQGLIGGVRNTIPRVIGCNIVVQVRC